MDRTTTRDPLEWLRRKTDAAPLVVAVALSFNGIAAVPFGVLYRKLGLEAAMIAHFTADFVIFVIGPAFLSK